MLKFRSKLKPLTYKVFITGKKKKKKPLEKFQFHRMLEISKIGGIL